MELDEFAANFPELYAIIEQDVINYIAENNMNGEETLSAWDSMIDSFVNNYEQNNYFGFNEDEVISQQLPYYDYRDWDRDYRYRRHRRRRFRDFDIRDILQLLFLRQLFGRRRRYY